MFLHQQPMQKHGQRKSIQHSAAFSCIHKDSPDSYQFFLLPYNSSMIAYPLLISHCHFHHCHFHLTDPGIHLLLRNAQKVYVYMLSCTPNTSLKAMNQYYPHKVNFSIFKHSQLLSTRKKWTSQYWKFKSVAHCAQD